MAQIIEIVDQGPIGFPGWSPIINAVKDGARVVGQIVDWIGGGGTKPASRGYIGVSGIVANIADAVDYTALPFLTNPTSLPYETRDAAKAASIPGSVDIVEVDAFSASHPKCRILYIRAAGTTPGGFQSVDGQWWKILNAVVELEMFGAMGDGTTNDQTAYNNANAFGRPIQTREESIYLITDFTNNGTQMLGRGKIVTAVTGGQRQWNTYADTDIAFGREYLSAAYLRMLVNQAAPAGVLGVILAGNSWVAGGSGEAPDDIVTVMGRTFTDNGIVNTFFTNLGVGGTVWSGLNVLPSLNTDNKLLIITYVVNEALGGLDSMAASARAKLAEIRADPDGAIDKLSIILVIPGATYDHPNSRDERWYEQIYKLYRQLSREFDCAVFDGYRYFRDASKAAGFWMDNPFADGRAIHPTQLMSGPFWSSVIDSFFPRATLLTVSTNRHTNRGSTTGVPAVTAQPNQFDFGLMQLRGTPGASWPQDGQIINFRHIDGPTLQMLHSYDTSAANLMTRIALPGFTAWSPWTGQKNDITFSNGWVPFSAGTHSVIRSASGTVTVNFTIKAGTTTAGTVVATLPAGFRPVHEIICLGQVAGSSGSALIEFRVEVDGDILGYGLNSGASALSVTFPAA